MSITCKISTCVIEGFGRGYSIQFYFRSRWSHKVIRPPWYRTCHNNTHIYMYTNKTYMHIA
jgi:hypothetical protein